MSILLKNVKYLDIRRENIEKGKDILIEGNRIVAIGENLSAQDAKVIDGTNKLVTPGFINAHTHLGMAMFRNYADDMDLMDWLSNKIWPLEDHLSSEDIYQASLLSMAELIRSGATCFCDMYYSMDRVGDAALQAGLRGFLTRGMTDITGGGEARLEDMRRLYENYHNKAKGRIKVIPAPHAIYTCSGEYLKQLIALTKELDGMLHIHLSETEVEVKDSLQKYGKTPIEYVADLGMLDLHVIAAHCVHMTKEEMELVKGKSFYPIYNPTSNLKLASGFAPVQEMLECGMTVGLGTDGSSSNNNQNMLEEIHIGAIVNKAVTHNPKAVPAIEMLKMATINGAKALGFDDLGAIEEGYLADLVVFDLESNNFTPQNELIHALCYSASSEDICHVICDGKLLMENRKLLTINEQSLRQEVNRHWEAVKQRAKESK